jgi:LmbE family N-acetylglucosaminyl deacetylase
VSADAPAWTGTDEAIWARAEPWARAPELDLAGVRRIVVVAPHPDDEVLGAAGLLQLPMPAVVLAVTDGEASHPDSAVLSPHDLARRRPLERRDALDRLGAARVPVRRLGHRDGAVDCRRLESELRAVLRPGDLCAVTARFDGHPDHEACGRAAVRAARACAVPAVEYPIWTWHRTTPEDPTLPWWRARRLTLGAARRAAKIAAVEAFTTQIAPLSPHEPLVILPPDVLAHLVRAVEVYFLAGETDTDTETDTDIDSG